MEEEEEEPDKLCFVVGPIGAEDSEDRIHSDWLLEMIIQPVMASFTGFQTKRADKIAAPGMIDAQIINALLNADLVIADMSTRNPNAFYEIGIRHMAQKPIIHMQLIDEIIPFDVSLYRAIKYSRVRPRDLLIAQEALKAQIEAVTRPEYQIENPVTRALGAVQIKQNATPEQRVLLDQISELSTRVSRLEIKDSSAASSSATTRLARLFAEPTPTYYGGGDPIPTSGTTIVAFITGKNFTAQQAEIINTQLSLQFGSATKIAQTQTELTFIVPGDININDFVIPRGLPKDLEISPLRPYPGSP